MQGVAKVDEVCEPTTDRELALLEGLEIALYVLLSVAQVSGPGLLRGL
jgi:hypothetical protein